MGANDNLCQVRRKDVLLVQPWETIIAVGSSNLLVLSLSLSFMGPAEVAAWGILGFLWETFEFITGKSDPSFRSLLRVLVCGMG